MDSDAARRRALGAFLRAHRERLSPAALGLPAGARRRTPGLRREELAQAGGLSPTWISWIEQGRDIAVSAAALARLSDALRLTAAERAYLFELAARRDPAGPAYDAASSIPDGTTAAILAFPGPAYLLDRLWTAQAWNPAARRLFVGWLDGPDRNLLRYIFLSPAARRLLPDWPRRARRVLAEFRADAGRHPGDPALVALTEGLRAASPVFARAWEEQAVVPRQGGERRFTHPEDGALCLTQVTATLADRPDLKLVLLVRT
ncbi:MAG: helix-turn-helix transcriptional regulator [Dongiaceae bacterium]